MAINIAVAGKGGTGKTSFCSMVIRYLIENKKVPVLAVDADANANLNETLGFELKNETVSELINSTKKKDEIPVGMTQETYIEYKLNASLEEGENVDLLVMGGPEGPGCYCFPNNILRKYLSNLTKSYKYIVMDNEAGLEHISRKTTDDIDYLFIIADNSARSIRSAGRVKELIDQIDTKVKNVHLVLTKSGSDDVKLLESEIEKTELDLAAVIPYDKKVIEYDVMGKALYNIPSDSQALKTVNKLLSRLEI